MAKVALGTVAVIGATGGAYAGTQLIKSGLDGMSPGLSSRIRDAVRDAMASTDAPKLSEPRVA